MTNVLSAAAAPIIRRYVAMLHQQHSLTARWSLWGPVANCIALHAFMDGVVCLGEANASQPHFKPTYVSMHLSIM